MPCEYINGKKVKQLYAQILMGLLHCCLLFLLFRPAGAAFLSRNTDRSLASEGHENGRSYERRYWNDDWEACIFKYCVDSAGYQYMQCMNTHCPGALVQIPRDLDDSEEPLKISSTLKPTGVQLICAGLLCQHVTSAHQLVTCFRSKCLDGELNVLEPFEDNADRDKEEQNSALISIQDVATDVETTGICAFLRCGTRHGRDYMACVKTKCGTSQEHHSEVKRRVNNPMVGMVQCTKQCSNSSDSSSRLVCIKSCQTKK